MIISCTPYRDSLDIPDGVFSDEILIRSEPTDAMIYINGRRIGETPFRTDLLYSEKRLINIKAVPIYPNQFTQNIFVMVPPIPKTMTIYMNEKPDFEWGKESDTIKPPKKRDPVVQIERDTVYVNQIDYYSTPTIFFDLDISTINDSQKDKLKKLASFLKQKSHFYIEIIGSADVRGNEDYNVDLSLRRAKAVEEYLVRRGVRRKRIVTHAKGETFIYNDDGKPLEYQANRTVIFELYHNKKDIKTMEERNEVLKD
jgi:outer membrane protein OmpA-like peptidoglycan-associated protein